MSTSVAVVGAGMGGLSAAAMLSARPEFDVTVLEASSDPGGKVGIAEYRGVQFDTGPSLLTLPSILEELFGDCHCDLRDEVTLFQPDPTARYHFPDGSVVDIAPQLSRTIDNVEVQLGTSARREFEEFVGYARRIWEAAAPHFVFGPAPTVLSAAKLGLTAMRDFLAIDANRRMLEAVNERIDDPRIRRLFLRYATFNGSDPRRAPATLHCIGWVDLGAGGYGIEGGMYELVLLLERLLRRQGAEIHYERPVSSVRPEGDGFRLQHSGGSLRADAVVVNTDVRHFVGQLWDGDGKPCSVGDEPPSASGFAIVLKAARRSETERPAHQVVFAPGDYIDEFKALFDRRRVPKRPAIYLCAREKAHRAGGWERDEPLFVMTQAPSLHDMEKSADWRRFEDQLLERLCERGLIDETDEVVWRQTPAGLARRFPGTRGSIYGAASNSRFAAFKRPANASPSVEGLYFAGGSVHPGGGVPLCIQSGRQAASELVQRH